MATCKDIKYLQKNQHKLWLNNYKKKKNQSNLLWPDSVPSTSHLHACGLPSC